MREGYEGNPISGHKSGTVLHRFASTRVSFKSYRRGKYNSLILYYH